MSFLYLVQSKDQLPYPELINCIYLTYGKQIPGAIYYPNSTWTTGRNRLLEEAKKMAKNGIVYDYYIFCDDDIIFLNGSWKTLEDKLMIENPMIGYPHMNNYPYDSTTPFMFDACLNAFSKHAIFNTDLLPYIDTYDAYSWWYSQLILIYRCLYMLNPNQLTYDKNITYNNVGHGTYPRGLIVKQYVSFIEKNYKSKIQNVLPHLEDITIPNIIKNINNRQIHKHAVIIYTSQSPSKSILHIINWCSKTKTKNNIYVWDVIIVADKNTPLDDFKTLNCILLDNNTQEKLYPKLYKLLPENHYSRKNIGYIYAIKNKYTTIAELNDDIYINDNWNTYMYDYLHVVWGNQWINIYKYFTDKLIWPRGLPISKKNNSYTSINKLISCEDIAIYQGLIDISPDCDAVYNLCTTNDNFTFDKNISPIAINNQTMCPFNSKNTIWKSCFEYLYLPSTVNGTYTDILRSYIANYGLQKHNKYLAYTPATATCERINYTNINILENELQIYNSWDIINNLNVHLNTDMDLYTMYNELYKLNIVDEQELNIIQAWLELFNNSV